MPSVAELAFNIIARDGASPAFKTVAAEAKALQAAMAEADAKMSASARSSTAEIDASLKSLAASHKAMTDGVIRDDTAMVDVTKATTAEMSAANARLAESMAASMRGVVAAQKEAQASTIEMGATVDRVAAEEAAATEASAVKRKASMMNYGLAAAGAVALIGYESVKAATSFEASMARVQTMAGASSVELKKMSDGILALAPQVGVGPDKLAESLYHIESAGFSGARALDMVAASAKLSAIGQDDINSSTQAVVATLASNIKGVRDANDAAAQILHTVGTGDMTMHQFTQALGTGLLATAAAVGLSFKDVGAAIATMTDNAIPADQAATKLRTSLLMMVNPSGPAAAALNSIGMNAQALAADLQKPDGLKTALDDIRTHLDAAFPKDSGIPLTIGAQKAALDDYRQTLATAGVQGKELDKAVQTYADRLKTGTTNTVLQEQAFAKMFGGSKNAGTMLVLFNEQLDRMNPKLASFGDANSRAAELQAAWAKQQDTFKQKLNDLGATFDVMKIKIGNALLPVLKDVVGFLGSHIGLVETLAAVIGGVLVAATVAWTAALLANPVVWFAAAIAAAAFSIYELTTNFQGVVKFLRGDFGTAILAATAILTPFISIPALIALHWNELPGLFKKIPGWIGDALSAAGSWLWDAGKKAAEGLWDGLVYAIQHANEIGQRLGKAIVDGIGNIGSFLIHLDWTKVAGALVDGLSSGIDWAWHNKGTVAKIAAIIGAGMLLVLLAIPASLIALGVGLVAGIVQGIYKGTQDQRHAVGKFFTDMLSGIKEGFDIAWGAVKRAFDTAWGAIKTGITDVLGFIRDHWRLLLVIFTGPIGLVIDFIYKFRDQIGAAFSFIAKHTIDQVQALWNVVYGLFKISSGLVLGIVHLLWDTAVAIFQVAAGVIAFVVRKLWDVVYGLFKTSSDAVLWVLRELWKVVYDLFRISSDFVIGIVTGLWHGLVDIATSIWHDVEKPLGILWDGLKTGFSATVDAIKTAWDRLHEIFLIPINFFIDPVYNKGVVPVWNFVMDVVGEPAGKLHAIPTLDAGGGLSGPNRGDDRFALVGGGEHMWTADEVAAAGGHERVAAIRSAIVGRPVRVMGDGSGAYADGGGVVIPPGALNGLAGIPTGPGYAGALGYANAMNDVRARGAAADAKVTSLLGALTQMVRGAAADVAAPALNGAVSVLDGLIGSAGGKWGHSVGQVGHHAVDKLIAWIRGADAKDQAAMAATLGGEAISWNGGSNTIGLIESLARGLPFGNLMQVTSTVRPWESGSYHAISEAVDFSNGTDTPQEAAFAAAWAAKYGSSLAELIHAGSLNIKDGRGVGDGMGFYGAGTMAQHHNHVHVAISPASIARGHQGFVPFSNAGGPAGETGIVQAVHSAAAARGWGGQLGALDYIIQHESGWNPNAKNPGSTAYGLFQMLYGAGNGVQEQITNGLNYIAGRYGNPNNAQAFWASHHWYANGGMPPIGQPFIVGENGPETMVLGAGGATVMPNGQSHRMAGSRGPLMHVENMQVTSPVDFELQLKQAQFLEQTVGAF